MFKSSRYAAIAALMAAPAILGGCYYAPARGYAYATPAYEEPAYAYPAPGYYAEPYGYAPYGTSLSLNFGGYRHHWR